VAEPDISISHLKFSDTHCHLDFQAFDQDREKVLERSRQAGVVQWMNPSVDVESSRRVVSLAHKVDNLYAGVGIHPTETDQCSKKDLEQIELLCEDPKVHAIGEIGIDHYHKNSPPKQQVFFFQEQLTIAAKKGLPVIVHSREAIGEVLDYLREWLTSLRAERSALLDRPGVLHSFEGNEEDGRKAIDLGFLLGVTGPITYLNAPERREVFRQLPLESLILETDAPFLTPHPYRGQRNEPAFIPITAQILADVHKTSLVDVAKMTSNNAARLFSWSNSD
jgi:TatD DNase family protein